MTSSYVWMYITFVVLLLNVLINDGTLSVQGLKVVKEQPGSSSKSNPLEVVNSTDRLSQGQVLSSSNGNEDLADATVLLTQVIFRHGDRSPIHWYPNDPHKNAWPHGLGQLTKVGKIQAYNLGLYLRNRYQHFLGKDYKHNEVYVRSTNVDRTLMTAECVTSGLFPLNTEKDNKSTLFWPVGTWQPIPVQTVPAENDRLLHSAHACEYIKDLQKGLEVSYSQEHNLITEKDLMLQLNKDTGMDINITSLHFLADILFCQKTHNMSRPVWMTPILEDRLMNCRTHRAKITPEDARYLAGVLLNTIIKNMLTRAQNESDLKKIYLYSAHDSTVGPLLSVLGHDDEIQVPYAAAVIIELHRIQGEYSVKLLYRNDTNVPPYKIQHRCNSRTLCPLDVFHEIYKDCLLTDEELEDVCHISPLTGVILEDSLIPILAAVLVALMGLDVFLGIKAYNYWQWLPKVPHQEQYSMLQAEMVSSDSETDINYNIRPNEGSTRVPSVAAADEPKHEEAVIN